MSVDILQVLEWVNQKLKATGKTTRIRSFRDLNITSSHPVLDLIDAIKPQSVDYGLVHEGLQDEDRLANARYAISMARKIGAKVYLLPEDMTEANPKMVMTAFACLMARGLESWAN